jgi:hypothetical protein
LQHTLHVERCVTALGRGARCVEPDETTLELTLSEFELKDSLIHVE